MEDKAQNKINIELIRSILKRAGSLVFLIPIIIAQIALFSAFEAHVINVTARICIPLETRTPGYWKTHEEITTQLLPKTLGDEEITTFEQAFDILDSDAVDMRDKLKSHLLAMKFNIAYYGVGDYYVESCDGIPIGDYINNIVAEADALLLNPDATREELEAIKNKLDCLNNLHEIRECAATSSLLNLFNSNVEIEISEEITPMTTEETPPAPTDTTPPVITLIDSDTINIFVGDSFTDPGATASDDVDGDITAKIVIVNPVDTNVAGTYTITYNVSDVAGNPAQEVIRTVIVSEKPAPPAEPTPPETLPEEIPPEETPPEEIPPEETPPETTPETEI